MELRELKEEHTELKGQKEEDTVLMGLEEVERLGVEGTEGG